MAYYIFTKAVRPPSGWELLETIRQPEVATQTFRDYQQLIGGRSLPKIALVEAEGAREGMACLRDN